MNFRLFLTILRKKALIVLVTLLATLATGAALTFTQPKRYAAEALLVINFETGNPLGGDALPPQLSASYLATQIDIIRSQRVARKAVEILDTEKDASQSQADGQAGARSTAQRDALAVALINDLSVENLPNSRVVRVRYETEDPGNAARIANAFTQAFIATSLELTVEPARRNAAWFDAQLKMLRERMVTAQSRLTEFQRTRKIVALDEKLGTENNRLADLSKSLVQAQQEVYDVRSRQLGENHPEYRRAVQRERSLSLSLEAQKANILEIKSQRDELDALAREVEVEQQTYAATLQNYYRTVMESQFNQTNIAILSAATPPAKPTSPDVLLNMLSATVLGVVLGILLALMTEALQQPAMPSGGVMQPARAQGVTRLI